MSEAARHAPVAALESGDLLLAASDVDDSNVDLRNHRGPGRILHLSTDFTPKSTLWTGVEGLLVGIAIDPEDGSIWCADPTARRLSRLAPDGSQLSLPPQIESLPERAWGPIAFDDQGRMLLGVLSRRGPAPDDALGAANLVRCDGAGWEGLTLETDGGHFGFHQVSSIALKGRLAAHLAEGGRRIFLHDLEENKPQGLLLDREAEGDDARVFGICAVADGWLVASGSGILRLAEDGTVTARWPAASERGWTRVTPAANGTDFFFNNFLEGVIERRRIADGNVIARHDIGRKYALCGVAEI